ncbi:MAG: hypothetical protein NZM43_10900 [Saprospiraceae bacterium]|nr:hypothetical protein [Saprospiraceae bacterium]MDW8484815.1 hypothetical protein [Saprospiraceae bacterium]
MLVYDGLRCLHFANKDVIPTLLGLYVTRPPFTNKMGRQDGPAIDKETEKITTVRFN